MTTLLEPFISLDNRLDDRACGRKFIIAEVQIGDNISNHVVRGFYDVSGYYHSYLRQDFEKFLKWKLRPQGVSIVQVNALGGATMEIFEDLVRITGKSRDFGAPDKELFLALYGQHDPKKKVEWLVDTD